MTGPNDFGVMRFGDASHGSLRDVSTTAPMRRASLQKRSKSLLDISALEHGYKVVKVACILSRHRVLTEP